MQEVFENIITNLENEVLKSSGNMTRTYAFEKAIEIVKQEAAEYNNGWIPCSERLPNKEEFLKAYIRNKYGAEFIVMIAGANRPTTLYLTTDGLWVDDCRNVHEVIGWHPLPEPYQPKGE